MAVKGGAGHLNRLTTGGDPVKETPRRSDLAIQTIDQVVVEVAVFDRILADCRGFQPRTCRLVLDGFDDVCAIHKLDVRLLSKLWQGAAVREYSNRLRKAYVVRHMA